ncbi:hypothetical protein E2C01_015777 [Portunus trituberculatus]|uniref:Uncharacterized protein n=1 Tax=Portunus trituberculatus TaxID=210409 RepID=A0A5B7DNY9_PORTR|nr:hypothetical protein [Portunus trituberculatus]
MVVKSQCIRKPSYELSMSTERLLTKNLLVKHILDEEMCVGNLLGMAGDEQRYVDDHQQQRQQTPSESRRTADQRAGQQHPDPPPSGYQCSYLHQ